MDSDALKRTSLETLNSVISPDARILAAVSGGKDSMTLMHLLSLMRENLGRVQIAHFDHGWRPDSEQDAIFVMEEAARCGFSCHLGRPDRTPVMDDRSEERARRLRYEFLIETAKTHGCDVVLTAHHADDQVETILHNLLRGTGLAGLAGMHVSRELEAGIRLVRPLLKISRMEIDRYIEQNGVSYREDVTNQSTEYTRNLLRHNVLSELEAKGFETTRESLLKLSKQADEVRETLQFVAKDLLDRVLVSESPEGVVLSTEELRDLPRHLQREVFVELWKRREWPRQEMGYQEWNRLAELIAEPARFHLPGMIDCFHKRGKVFLQRESERV